MKYRKNDTRFHEEMKQASTAVYGDRQAIPELVVAIADNFITS